MKIETVIALLIVTMLNTIFTLWMTSDNANIALQHRAEHFLATGMQCVDTGLVTAGANEYAKVFDCGDD
jgi:hypothetical protein